MCTAEFSEQPVQCFLMRPYVYINLLKIISYNFSYLMVFMFYTLFYIYSVKFVINFQEAICLFLF